MKYIILAAGMGKRLHPFTKDIPKCMLQIGQGLTLATRMVEIIRKYDPSANITYVLGFKHKEIENYLEGCDVIVNPFYSITNSIVSLWFARDRLNERIAIINGDIIISELLMEKIVRMEDKPVVLVDSSIKNNGDYNVQVNGQYVVVMSKELDTYYGEYAGITMLDKKSAILLRQEIDNMIDSGSINEWYENALVQMVLNSDFRLHYYDIADYEWHEIDSVNDLLAARELINREKIR